MKLRTIAFAALLLMNSANAYAYAFDCKSIGSDESLAAAQPDKLQSAKSFTYREANGSPLRLYVFDPPYHQSSDKDAAIVFFFGGGWVLGTVAQFVPHARYLAQRGMVSIVADYRVRCRQGTTPFDAMSDARMAIRWVRLHASMLGIDPNRLVASGGSAGGHLAVSTAIFDGSDVGENQNVSSEPNALILFNPWLGAVTPNLKPLLPSDLKAQWAMSPLEHLRNDMPPTLILQGRADTTTPYVTALDFCNLAKASGADCEVVGYEGAEHGFFNAPADLPHSLDNPQETVSDDWYRQTLFEADKFLERLGYFSSGK